MFKKIHKLFTITYHRNLFRTILQIIAFVKNSILFHFLFVKLIMANSAALNEKKRNDLKEIIQNKFGQRITHSKICVSLAESIYNETGKIISSNTLRRFFGFIATSFLPSINSLNILSEYAGYENWSHFIQSASGEYEILSPGKEAEIYFSFYRIDIKQEADMNYHNACRTIALRILQNQLLLKQMVKKLADIDTARIYFYERFPYIDGLCNTTYISGVKNYIRTATQDAAIFGNALLFLSEVLQLNEKKITAYYHIVESLQTNEHSHPFVIARQSGTILLYKHLTKQDTTDILARIKKEAAGFSTIKKIKFWHYPYYQHMACDYLNLAGFYKESTEVLKTIPSEKNYEVEKGYEEALSIISNIAKSGHNPESYTRWLAGTHHFHNVHPLFKKYMRMQALYRASAIITSGKKSLKYRAELDALVQETGFKYFKNNF